MDKPLVIGLVRRAGDGVWRLAELLRQLDAGVPESRTLSRPRQCCWDAAARSDALFMWNGPSTSKPQLLCHMYQTTSAITARAHMCTHRQQMGIANKHMHLIKTYTPAEYIGYYLKLSNIIVECFLFSLVLRHQHSPPITLSFCIILMHSFDPWCGCC